MFTATVLGAPLYTVLWFFFIFSFLGVVLEMIFCLSREGVLESRLGLLYLPLSPIYGCGAVVLSAFLRPYVPEPVAMFFLGMLVGSVLEYVVSLVMEKAFHTVFWDYSDKPLNIHGRVCLQYSVYWGFLSILLLYVIDRWAVAFIQLIPRDVGDLVLLALIVLTAVSILLTLAAFAGMRRKVEALESGHPEPAGAADRLITRLAPDKVVINTFPRMSLVQDYMHFTGQQRAWIRVDLHLGKPSAIHRRMRHRTEVAAAGD